MRRAGGSLLRHHLLLLFFLVQHVVGGHDVLTRQANFGSDVAQHLGATLRPNDAHVNRVRSQLQELKLPRPLRLALLRHLHAQHSDFFFASK